MLHQHRLFLLAMLAILAAGCRKDRGSDAPTVRILEPGAGFTVLVPDTIMVRVLVSDDIAVERLVVMIADQEGIPIAPSRVVNVGLASATIDVELPVLNEGIASGTYQIIARASDADQDAQAFLPIAVNAEPLRRLSIFLAPRSGAPYTISRIDSAGVLNAFATLDELNGASICPAWLCTAGGTSEDLRIWDPVTGAYSLLMTNPGVSGSAPYFWNPVVDQNDGRLYIGTWDGLIRGFGPTGDQTFSASLMEGFQSRVHVKVDDVLLSLAYAPAQDQWRSIPLTYNAGAQLASFPLQFAPFDGYELDDDHALVFGNNATGGVIAEVSVDQGGVSIRRQFDSDSLLQVAAMQDGSFAIASTAGILRYQVDANSILILQDQRPDAIAFDRSIGAVVAAFGQELRTIDPVSGALIGSIAIPQPASQVLIQLNR